MLSVYRPEKRTQQEWKAVNTPVCSDLKLFSKSHEATIHAKKTYRVEKKSSSKGAPEAPEAKQARDLRTTRVSEPAPEGHSAGQKGHDLNTQKLYHWVELNDIELS